MRFDRLTSSIAVALLLASPFAQAQSAPIAKQLAGPPAEFDAMRAPLPAEGAIHSKSALLPVRMTADKAGNASWTARIPVEGGAARFMVFAGATDSWDVELVGANGVREKAARRTVSEIGIEQQSFSGDYYTYSGLGGGTREFALRARSGAPRDGFVLIEGDSSTELASYASGRQVLGERVAMTAMLTSTDVDDNVVMGKSAGRVARAELEVTAPGGERRTYPMYDDGRHADGLAADGVFGGDFAADATGSYLAQVRVHGTNRAGQDIVRTAEHVVPVVERSLALAGAARGAAQDGTRVSIRLPVETTKAAAGAHYRAYAEVWGRDGRGAPTPVAWISGMVDAKAGGLDLGFDERWVARAKARAPFELRNVRVEDPNHFVTVTSAERLDLDLPEVRTKARGTAVAIDDVMQQGPRPASLATSEKGVGSRLLLVHGYCSGGVWPAAQFSNASTFLDVNQNRTHDQFARLIQSFGATWNSFGVVAHSQGGAASLHLYTYYWSGLDNAVGSRLIQSVGTPYKGTNLSGILASLGNWFGVGCGTNSNMTYSGATSWLAGIPTSARAKVNYYTTAFRTTNWYTNDYCQIATDLVLSDPEDGTTEQVNGQLSGGVNRGHTSGQCHTAGMRDPAQYHDASRNATLNANAAR